MMTPLLVTPDGKLWLVQLLKGVSEPVTHEIMDWRMLEKYPDGDIVFRICFYCKIYLRESDPDVGYIEKNCDQCENDPIPCHRVTPLPSADEWWLGTVEKFQPMIVQKTDCSYMESLEALAELAVLLKLESPKEFIAVVEVTI